MNYYNENDPFAAAWLRNLIANGIVPPGEVDDRSIADVRGSDVAGFTQCHFFAGIGGWSCALQLANWPVDRPVWTGSCPCQPLSAAGQRKGEADKRHLWPELRRLITECSPAICFGEQVASKDGKADGHWGSFGIFCRDGKTRRIEPSIQPLAHGIPGRMGLLRGFGNAIVPQVASEFIRAYWEAVAIT